MKKTILLITYCLLVNLFSYAQPATDINCQPNVFYGNSGSNVHLLQLNSNTITDLGIFTSSTLNLFSLAFGNDITENSNNRTLYSSAPNPAFTSSTILRYTGTTWDSITTDTILYHNAGAYGPFIYFQHGAAVGSVNDQCISRLNSNGTLTKIFTDTSLVFTVADIAVDSVGNIYCFRGTSIGNTTEITVLNSNGAIINSFSTTLNNLTTLYGAMFLNGTLYVGWNTTNGKIYPVNFSGTTASLGTPLSVPVTLSFRDLASCHDSVSNDITTIPEKISGEDILLFPNPSGGEFTISLPVENSEIIIQDVLGKQILVNKAKEKTIHFHCEESGVYLIFVRAINSTTIHKLVVNR